MGRQLVGVNVLALGLAMLASLATAAERQTLEWQDLPRSFAIVRPDNGGKPQDLVVVLHGAGGNGEAALTRQGWAELAPIAGFIAVAPDALPPDIARPPGFRDNPRYWNDGGERTSPAKAWVDDVGFLDRLIAAIKAQAPVDRVFMTGFSSGAAMTIRFAAARPGLLTAVAAIAGHPSPLPALPDRLPSLLYATGTRDPLNPIGGGEVRIAVWSARFTKVAPITVPEGWARALACAGSTDTRPGEDLRLIAWQDCRGGAQVRYYELVGLGHHWPGAGAELPESMAGPVVPAIDGLELVWSFFNAR
ncbi:MAG: alpha/beta hydrolase family esterase [Ferrovibrionaceae bacterium]